MHMNNPYEILPDVFYVGVNDRTKHRFEGLWPLPLGVSYNSYLIKSEKTALIDTVDAAYTDIFLQNIRACLGGRGLDYLVVNHMEPDHSASIAAVRREWPEIKIVGNAKTLSMIEGYYGLSEGTHKVDEGDAISIGPMLRFYMIPMVHWPETMVTYCPELKAVFSGDAFGCFGAIDGGITDEEMNTDRYWDEMIRYYSNIVGKYGVPVQNALKKVSGLEISTICSTHGPVWKKNIGKVVDIYDRLSRYEAESGAVIAYGSMYGNTAQIAEHIARQLAVRGVGNIVVHDLSHSHESYVLRDIFKYNTLVIGGPTYNGGMFPPVEALTAAIESRCIPHRNFGCFGSFTWAGACVRKLTEFAARMKWEVAAGPLEMKQGATPEKLSACAQFAEALTARM